MHPFTDAAFVKDCILAAVDVICPEQHDAFMAIPLSSCCLPALQLDAWRTWPLMSGLRCSRSSKVSMYPLSPWTRAVTSRTLCRWPSLCVASGMTKVVENFLSLIPRQQQLARMFLMLFYLLYMVSIYQNSSW